MKEKILEKDDMPTVNLDKVKEARISFKLSGLFAVIISLYYAGAFANSQYVHWHDTRYAKKAEIITVAQAELIKNELGSVSSLAYENSSKLDAQSEQLKQLSDDFNTYAASTLVSQARAELRAHILSKNEHTDISKWTQDKKNLELKVTKAEEYRTCVIAGQSNCGRFLLVPN